MPDPWQTEGTEFGRRNKRFLLPLPTGSGKTYILLKVAHELGCSRILVLCSGNALYTWQKNIAKHLPDLFPFTAVISKMKGPDRQAVYVDPNIRCIVMKVKTFLYDHEAIMKLRRFDMVIGDESQNFMRKHTTAQYEKLDKLFQVVPNIGWASAHPASKGRQELYPLLHSARPGKFNSYWRFVSQFCHVDTSGFGRQITGPRNTEQFRRDVGTTIYYPSMPITNIPEIRRSTIPCEMDPDVARMYKAMDQDMFTMLTSGEILLMSTVLAKITRLRQILCCPAILDVDLGAGTGMEMIIDHMQEDEERQHCVWFVPFTAAIPYAKRMLEINGFPKVVVFRGGMTVDELNAAENYFRDNPDSQAVCSIKYSQSFELETGTPAYFCGYDWDPYVNAQGEGRLARRTSKYGFLPSYYIQHLGTFDDRMLAINSDKISNTKVDETSVTALKTLWLPKSPS